MSEEPRPEPGQITDFVMARQFVLLGRSIFTVVSNQTEQRFTFKVTEAEQNQYRNAVEKVWFVGFLSGPDNTEDYQYLGMLYHQGGAILFRTTRKTRVAEDAKVLTAWRWLWDALGGLKDFGQVRFYHSGRCGKCGRVLTDPESIKRGVGPTCFAALD